MRRVLFKTLNRCWRFNEKTYLTMTYPISFWYLIFYTIILFASDRVYGEVANELHSLTGRLSSGSVESHCQGALLDWVKEDLRDRAFTVDFKNKNSQCLAQAQQLKVNHKGSNEVFFSSEIKNALDHYFQTRVASNYLKRSFDECIASNSDGFIKNSMIRRFYFSALKTESSNSRILDEIAYYDSILKSPLPIVLHGVDCATPILSVKEKCEHYKKSLLKCKESTKVDKINSLVDKTKDYLDKIEGLKFAHRKCLKKTQRARSHQSHLEKNATNTACEPLLQAISLLEDQVPWVKGTTFQELAIIHKPSYRNGFRTGYEVRSEKIKLAIINQLEENRKALLTQFKKNNFYFGCLLGMPNGQSYGPNYDHNQNSELTCNPTSLTDQYIHQPEVELGKSLPDLKADRLLSFFESELKNENCLLKVQNDLDQLNKKVSKHGMTILMTSATLGVSGVAGRLIIKAANSVSQAARSTALVNGAASGFWAGETVRQNLKDCRKESDVVIKLTAERNSFDVVACESSHNPIDQALARENDCLLGAVLSAPSLLPFVGAVPGLVVQSKYINKLSLSSSALRSKSTSSTTRSTFTESSPSEFSTKIDQISEESRKYVRVRTVKEYESIVENGGKLFLNSNKTVGYGVTKEGELISVFKLTEEKGQVALILDSAARNGATHLTVLKGSPAEKAYLKSGLTPFGDPFTKTPNEYTTIEAAWGVEQAAKLVRQKMNFPNQ